MVRLAVSWVLMGLALLAVPAKAGEELEREDPLDALEQALHRRPWPEVRARLEALSDTELGALLDRSLRAEKDAYRRPRVTASHILAERIRGRRLAGSIAAGRRATRAPDAPAVGVLDYPRTDGSTSTLPLERVLACRVFGAPFVWGGPEELRRAFAPVREPPSLGGMPFDSGVRVAVPLAERFARAAVVADVWDPDHERLAAIINGLLVRHRGTHEAWVRLIEGEADLVFVARLPNDRERALAEQQGVDVESVPIAKDAFVFLASRLNPVSSLTLPQIRGIYRGEITNWREVGGADEGIRPYGREANSGSQALFHRLVLPASELPARRRDLIQDSMIGPFSALETDTTGIAYTVWYYAWVMAVVPEVKVLALDGVDPTPATIADGRYPLVTTVYAAVRADAPEQAPARRLLAWFSTPSGQEAVAASGYVPTRAARR